MGKVSASSFAPLAAATREAATRPGSIIVEPPINSAAGSPDPRIAAISSTVDAATRCRGVGVTGATGPGASIQHTSAGRMSVATCPGGPIAAATASAASWATEAGSVDERIHDDTPAAIDAMSLCSGASYSAW